ncbi:MAG: type II toxin-antitoxin system Phd/YefM family antitoxin [Alphaproteobacteria bacterium]
MSRNFIHANMHEFKTHFSRYVRALERREYQGVIVKRHGRFIGLFVLKDYASLTPLPPCAAPDPLDDILNS